MRFGFQVPIAGRHRKVSHVIQVGKTVYASKLSYEACLVFGGFRCWSRLWSASAVG